MRFVDQVTIEVESGVGEGTAFIIELEAIDEPDRTETTGETP